MFRIYQTPGGCTIEKGGEHAAPVRFSFDELFIADDPHAYAEAQFASGEPCGAPSGAALPPVGTAQEVWAAGVTYYRSRTARMEESESSGGDRFYDLVYEAERPELFFKATPARCRGHLDKVGIRSDSTWDVPEPELALAINAAGRVFGHTIGNDMSSRSIEGENPLYLPQAKVYKGSCSLGPCLVVGGPPPPATKIAIEIRRAGEVVFSGDTEVAQIKRGFDELAEFLYRDNEFPAGALLMTGTGVVPESDFTLAAGDVVAIAIDGVGELQNEVEESGSGAKGDG